MTGSWPCWRNRLSSPNSHRPIPPQNASDNSLEIPKIISHLSSMPKPPAKQIPAAKHSHAANVELVQDLHSPAPAATKLSKFKSLKAPPAQAATQTPPPSKAPTPSKASTPSTPSEFLTVDLLREYSAALLSVSSNEKDFTQKEVRESKQVRFHLPHPLPLSSRIMLPSGTRSS